MTSKLHQLLSVRLTKKTLVIHPRDKSTDFLKQIYMDIPNVTVVTGGKFQYQIHDLINTHDRIIMMGHGGPNGLFGMGKFKGGSNIIDRSSVRHLMNKECIYIWCHASSFVVHNHLKGFTTGMFVSEVGESIYCGVQSTQEEITSSNEGFTEIVSEFVNEDLSVLHDKVKRIYGGLFGSGLVGNYNNDRIRIF